MNHGERHAEPLRVREGDSALAQNQETAGSEEERVEFKLECNLDAWLLPACRIG